MMTLRAVEHSAEVHPVQAPGRRKLYVGRCSGGDFVGRPRVKSERAWSDVQEHTVERTPVTTYEAVLVLRVPARSRREALVNLRRMMIRLATRRGWLERSLQDFKPVTTKVGR